MVAVKPIAFGAITLGEFSLPMVFDGGVFLFPLAYVLGDLLTEVYGLKASRRAILTAFGLALVASLTILVVQISPPAAGWEKMCIRDRHCSPRSRQPPNGPSGRGARIRS